MRHTVLAVAAWWADDKYIVGKVIWGLIQLYDWWFIMRPCGHAGYWTSKLGHHTSEDTNKNIKDNKKDGFTVAAQFTTPFPSHRHIETPALHDGTQPIKSSSIPWWKTHDQRSSTITATATNRRLSVSLYESSHLIYSLLAMFNTLRSIRLIDGVHSIIEVMTADWNGADWNLIRLLILGVLNRPWSS